MLIIALVRSRSQETRQAPGKHGITQMLMTSMAVSDFIFGVFLMPLGVSEITNNGNWNYGLSMCQVRTSFTNILCAVSVFHVNCLALDKLLAVYKPMWYRLRTVRTGYVMVSFSWLFPVALTVYCQIAVLNQMETSNQSVNPLVMFFLVVAFYLPCMLAYVLYAAILQKVLRYNRKDFKPKYTIERSSVGIQYTEGTRDISKISESTMIPGTASYITCNISNDEAVPKIGPRDNATNILTKQNGKNDKRSGRAIYTIGSLMVCFTICWVPSWLGPPILTDDQLPFWFSLYGYWVGYCNSALNPVLCCLNRSVRQAVSSFVQSVIKAVISFVQQV
ncbi:5-hydroxytryptamine receptor 5B-like [Physella acuta]|uniref:5-hydroxytryptamine receptor 5B-like n=1 Tax=Physella acuta TaxID=109671 RepID=UPI0027DB262E|nr:5-hydroxytryptamine receptor 5B-like [Physella acuta]